MRKDLNMSPGKLAAQVAHCAEAYWTRMLSDCKGMKQGSYYNVDLKVDGNIMDEYIGGIFTKTICEAKNKNQLLKAKEKADELGLAENVDYGLIYDACLTELDPEEPDGTTLTGIWFRPLLDDVAHEISKKYQLYR